MSSPKPVRFTIYCHTHIESGRRYIGQTARSMMRRWSQHVSQSKHAKKLWYFPNAIRKYGKDAFSHEILKVCISLEEANAYEEYFIDLFRTRDPGFGFNLARGGEHKPHPVLDKPWNRPEFREKALRSLAKANDIPQEVRSERSRELWRDSEFRNQISNVLRNNMSNPDMKDRVVSRMKSSFATPESKMKRSESSKRLWQDPRYRAKNAELWQNGDFRVRCESGLKHGASINAAKTHCPHGHAYSSENTVVNSKGSRECLICARRSKMESARRRRAYAGLLV